MGCKNEQPDADQRQNKGNGIFYAQHFRLDLKDDTTKSITIVNPWQGAVGVKYHNPKPIKPPARVVCMSTTHLGFLEALGQLHTVVGLSGTQYAYNNYLQERIKNGEVEDVGYDEHLNYEKIYSLKPDMVFLFGVTAAITKTKEKLDVLQVPNLIIAEYLEHDPLARLEWLKVFGLVYHQESLTDSIFTQKAIKYLKMKELVSGVKDRPKVMTALPFKGSWYVPGRDTYLSRLIADAGGHYIWRDVEGDVMPFTLERALQTAVDADIWINCGVASSIADIKAVDPRITRLQPIKNKMVYNNNARYQKDGGSDYWESGAVNPDLVLIDLVSIFHPDLLPSQDLYYYQKIY